MQAASRRTPNSLTLFRPATAILSTMLTFVAIVIVGAVALPDALAAEATFDSNGTPIRYIDEGKGPTLVLIHGFAGNADMHWVMSGMVRSLANDYRVLAIDCRGHGRSGKPHDVEKYGKEMSQDVVRLLDHLEIEKALVMGYSMGGMITLDLLTEHPDRVVAAVPGGFGWNHPATADSEMLQELAKSLEEGRGFGPLFRGLTPEGDPEPTTENMARINALLQAMNDTKALAAVVRGWKGLTVTEKELRANKIPTLLIIGERDPLKAGVDALDGVMTNAEIVVLEKADHMSAMSSPAFLAKAKEFLAKHAEKAAPTPVGTNE